MVKNTNEVHKKINTNSTLFKYYNDLNKSFLFNVFF